MEIRLGGYRYQIVHRILPRDARVAGLWGVYESMGGKVQGGGRGLGGSGVQGNGFWGKGYRESIGLGIYPR